MSELNLDSRSLSSNPFFPIMAGLGYFLLFLLCNVTVTFVIMVYFGMEKKLADGAIGRNTPLEELSDYMMQKTTENANSLLILYSLLFLLLFVTISAVRKKNPLSESNLRGLPINIIPVLFMVAIGSILFFDSIINLLPDSAVENFSEESSFVGAGTFGWSLLAKALLGPIVEELTFRGLAFGRFRKGIPTWAAMLLSSLLFGLVHGELLWMINAFFLGILLCLVADFTNTILSSIFVHVTFNAFGVIWTYHNVPFPDTLLYVFPVVGLLLILLGFFLLCRQKKLKKGSL